jgi:hypothetical protein
LQNARSASGNLPRNDVEPQHSGHADKILQSRIAWRNTAHKKAHAEGRLSVEQWTRRTGAANGEHSRSIHPCQPFSLFITPPRSHDRGGARRTGIWRTRRGGRFSSVAQARAFLSAPGERLAGKSIMCKAALRPACPPVRVAHFCKLYVSWVRVQPGARVCFPCCGGGLKGAGLSEQGRERPVDLSTGQDVQPSGYARGLTSIGMAYVCWVNGCTTRWTCGRILP